MVNLGFQAMVIVLGGWFPRKFSGSFVEAEIEIMVVQAAKKQSHWKRTVLLVSLAAPGVWEALKQLATSCTFLGKNGRNTWKRRWNWRAPLALFKVLPNQDEVHRGWCLKRGTLFFFPNSVPVWNAAQLLNFLLHRRSEAIPLKFRRGMDFLHKKFGQTFFSELRGKMWGTAISTPLCYSTWITRLWKELFIHFLKQFQVHPPKFNSIFAEKWWKLEVNSPFLFGISANFAGVKLPQRAVKNHFQSEGSLEVDRWPIGEHVILWDLSWVLDKQLLSSRSGLLWRCWRCFSRVINYPLVNDHIAGWKTQHFW